MLFLEPFVNNSPPSPSRSLASQCLWDEDHIWESEKKRISETRVLSHITSGTLPCDAWFSFSLSLPPPPIRPKFFPPIFQIERPESDHDTLKFRQSYLGDKPTALGLCGLLPQLANLFKWVAFLLVSLPTVNQDKSDCLTRFSLPHPSLSNPLPQLIKTKVTRYSQAACLTRFSLPHPSLSNLLLLPSTKRGFLDLPDYAKSRTPPSIPDIDHDETASMVDGSLDDLDIFSEAERVATRSFPSTSEENSDG